VITCYTFAKKCEDGFNHPVILTEAAAARKQRIVGIECQHFDAPRAGVCLSKTLRLQYQSDWLQRRNDA
jgi:hypothetical protein